MTVAAIAVAGVGAAASIGGSMMASKAQGKAGQQAQAAQNQNLQQQQQLAAQARDQNIPIISDAARQAMGYVAPYAESGQQANTALQQQMGLIPDANGYFNNTLTNNFDNAAYQKDVGYTPLTSNRFSREQYGKLNGVPALVSNTLSADEWKNDGTGTYTATPTTLEELQATPGYQFQLQQGLQSVNNSAAAKGSLMSGATLKSLNNYAQGQASTGFADAWNRGQQAYQNAFARKNTQFQQGQQGYADQYARQQQQYQQGQDAVQNAYNRFGQNQNNAYSRLAGMAGSGQQAAGQQAQYATQAARDIAQQNNNYANSQSGASQNYADNTGNIAYGQGQQKANMYTGVGNSLTDLAGKYVSTAGTTAGTGNYCMYDVKNDGAARFRNGG